MWRYHPNILATPVPRYTSYPTAADFTDDIGTADFEAALADASGDVSLYLHIPYCHDICWYCGCNTGAANKAARLDAYVRRLGEEIDLVGRKLNAGGRVSRVAWGGGSPNALAVEQFDYLSRKLHDTFACRGVDTSIELDPRSLTPQWADALDRHAVTRASLGVQTFACHVQAAIGRVQPYEMIADGTSRLRAAGITSLNFDLMYGLPGQTDEDLESTLHAALALRPDRLAVFGYAHVPHLLPRQRRIAAVSLPDAGARFAQAWLAYELLLARGYAAIGFDHFARPDDPLARAARAGRLRRNFQGFTDDDSSYLIGLGASAISSFPGLIAQNEKNSGRYHARLQQGQFAAARGVRRSTADRVRAVVIESLLCQGEADCAGVPDLPLVKAGLEPFEALGLIAWERDRLSLSADALPYARTIAAGFDSHRAGSKVQFSSAI